MDVERVGAAASAVGEVRQQVWPEMGITPSGVEGCLRLDMDGFFHVVHPGAQRSLLPSEEYRYWGH